MMWRDARQRLKLRQLELQLRSAELRLGLVHDAQGLGCTFRFIVIGTRRIYGIVKP